MHKFTGTPTMENSNVLNLRSKITENRFGPWHPPPRKHVTCYFYIDGTTE